LGARAAGVRRGAYHFFDPTEDGTAQAERFLATVGAYEPGDLPPMLDLECPDGDDDCLGTGASGQAEPAAIAARMWAWIRAVEGATGTRPIVYTFSAYFRASGVDPTGLQAYPLFLGYPTTGACLPVPAPWSTATLWQYSWSGTVAGIRGLVDRDRFLGSTGDLFRLGFPRDASDGSAAPDAALPRVAGCL
jgi:lysozyme